MNWNIVEGNWRYIDWHAAEGNWKQFRPRVKSYWKQLTEDHLDAIAGNRDRLAAKIKVAYGVTRDEVENQIKTFERRNENYHPLPMVKSSTREVLLQVVK